VRPLTPTRPAINVLVLAKSSGSTVLDQVLCQFTLLLPATTS
jgi:hypothetical protein